MRHAALALTLALACGCSHDISSIPEGSADGQVTEGQQPSDASAPSRDGQVPGGRDAATNAMRDSGADASSAPPVDSGISADGGDAQTPSPACTDEGAMRCAGTGSPARERCESGQWVSADDCAADEVCDSTDAATPGSCRPTAAHCLGNGGKSVCIDADMHQCSVDGVDVRTTACDSARLCQQGVEAGACPLCEPGTFQCEGAQLRKCDEAGLAYVDEELCDTAALCNALAGACTAAACLPTTKVCQGDDLQKCNAAQDGFELDQSCGAGLCDMAAGECDVCFPGTRDCAGNTARQCNAQGQGYMETPCTGSADICTGDGVCVQCRNANDCTPPSNPCRVATCNVGAGTCGTANRPARYACAGGVCNGSGTCVPCIDDNDCGASQPVCSASGCVECIDNGDCTQPINDCREAVCQSNSCVTRNKQQDATCSSAGGSVCDGGGNCVECTAHAQCGGDYCSGNVCVQCLSAANCAAGVCEVATCVAGSCVTTIKDGDGCGAGMVCNQGTCQVACGNGRVDDGITPPEECDPTAPQHDWYDCDPATCRSRTYYTVCSVDANCDGNCWNETNAMLYYCAPPCSTDNDCPGLPFPNTADIYCVNGDCAIYCTNGGNADCPPHLTCQYSGPVGACVN